MTTLLEDMRQELWKLQSRRKMLIYPHQQDEAFDLECQIYTLWDNMNRIEENCSREDPTATYYDWIVRKGKPAYFPCPTLPNWLEL